MTWINILAKIPTYTPFVYINIFYSSEKRESRSKFLIPGALISPKGLLTLLIRLL